MKPTTLKILLIITIVFAIAVAVIKTIGNTNYYNLVKLIDKNYDEQHQVDYQDN